MYLNESLKDELSNIFCETLNCINDGKKISKIDADMLIEASDTETLLAYIDTIKDQTIINLGYPLNSKDYPKEIDENFDALIVKVMKQANENRKSKTYSGLEVISSRTTPNIDNIINNYYCGNKPNQNGLNNDSQASPRSFD